MRRRRALVGLASAMVTAALGGCHVVRWQGKRLRRSIIAHGMTESSRAVGPHHVHGWQGGAARDETVVLLHGFGASATWQWSHQIEALRRDYAVLAPDLLGFGGSRAGTAQVTLEDQADMVAGWIGDERRVHVVGISYGGLVAYMLAVRHPALVEKLVLVDSPGPVWTEQDRVALLERFGVPDEAALLLPDDPHDVQRLLDLAYAKPPRTPKFVRRQVLRDLYAPWREPQARLLDSLIEHRETYAALPAPQAGVALIWGEDDPVFPLEIAHRLQARLGAPLRVIPNARHAPNLEHPQAFNEALLASLRLR